MAIHQISVGYDQKEDRLLLRVRSRQNQLYPVWITRRLALRLWPVFSETFAKVSAASLSTQATVHPDARDMLVEAAREETLKRADFQTPFDDKNLEHPLGAQPLLAHEVQFQSHASQLRLAILDAGGRQLALELDPTMVAAVHELMLKALRESEWGVEAPPQAAPAPSRLLN